MKLKPEIISFLKNQGYVIISTIDAHGNIHCSAKGIVGFDSEGMILVADLFCGQTYKNLKKESRISLTVIDERNFIGYTLQGNGNIIPREEVAESLLEAWEDHILKRMSHRVVKSVQVGASSRKHFEAHLPRHPKHFIQIEVKKVIDLVPGHLRDKRNE